MKKIMLGLFILGITTQMYAQSIELPEVEVTVNYKYLNATDSEQMALPVKKLVDKVLEFEADKSDFYVDEYGTYNVSFYIPEGKIVAAYNKKGEILRTIEKYKNVRLPLDVLRSIATRFPNWSVVEDIYLVNFHYEKGVTKKLYKIKLKNVNKIVNIQTDESGNFI
ncbi:MAG: hypothetical protein ACI9OE_000606 [Mariniflexile sp.]|jgi:hypothetical protein